MSIKILSWNIMSGGYKDYSSSEKKPGRINQLSKVVQELQPDLVSLIDTHRWTEVYKIKDLQKIFNYPKVKIIKLEDQRLIAKGHENGIAVFSKLPEFKAQTIWLKTRQAIKSQIDGIDIFSVYFDDLCEALRVDQLETVLKLVDKSKPTIILGDLNSFDCDDLAETSRNLDELAQKFPKQVKMMKETAFNEMMKAQVTKIFKKNGFRDLGKGKGNTVPAKLFPLPSAKPLARLDYAFANELIKVNDFEVLTEEKFAVLSDHYPIYIRVEKV